MTRHSGGGSTVSHGGKNMLTTRRILFGLCTAFLVLGLSWMAIPTWAVEEATEATEVEATGEAAEKKIDIEGLDETQIIDEHVDDDDDDIMDDDDDESDELEEKVDPADAPIAVDSVNLDSMTEEQLTVLKTEAEPHEFQAEVYRLMDIIINSLYTKKEVFLRELVSNGADALEKMRFLAIENQDVLGETRDLKIVVEYDNETKTLTIADSGVGMTKQDLINNLGTVAKSGTTNFLEAIAHGGDVNLIGQFGVGFYSAFLVADKVTVTSKHNDDDQHVWESTADASFTVAKDPRGNTLGRGTRITLHLKEDSMEFLKKSTLVDLLKKYSQFVNFPIYIRVEKTVTEEVPVEEEEKQIDEDEDEVKVEEGEEEKKPKIKKIEKTVHELKKLNIQKPIWMRPKEEITEEEYSKFYKSLVKDESSADPIAHVHFTAEGEIEFRAILFVPPRIATDPYAQYFSKKHDIKLYVRRVLVSEQFEDIIPNWLSFVRGVIDSDDLPLKVDRESVSQLKVIKVISKRVTRKVLDVLRKMSIDSETASDDLAAIDDKVREEGRVSSEEANPDKEVLDYNDEEKETITKLKDVEYKYTSFWRQFGKNMKLGCVDDDGGNRGKIGKLLRYHTTKSTKEPVSLQKVFDRLPESASSIYYLTGENVDRMLENPLLQGFLKKGIEVLLLSDAVDESCVSSLQDFEGKKLVSIEKGDVALDESEDEKEYFEKLRQYYKPLTTWWKKYITKTSPKISKVQLSNRLVNDPVGVVASQYGTTAFGEKIVRYQTFVDANSMMAGKVNKILEINPQHPIIREMRRLHELNEEDPQLKSYADGLGEAAIMASGFPVDNPVAIANKLYQSMATTMKVDTSTKLDDIDLSDFKVDEEAKKEAGAEKKQEEFDELTSYLKASDLEKVPDKKDDDFVGDDAVQEEPPKRDEL